jgi:hypothetical protein
LQWKAHSRSKDSSQTWNDKSGEDLKRKARPPPKTTAKRGITLRGNAQKDLF